ncbi:hypothetical protein [Mesorhizobium sp.]|uniref:hypothetical protein n=1 Tax=Mesorhizobium sp. TaxID=1871066 RepID=UPI000FE4F979|nr:hypothetical protein [Mesorhizobium sp.]RWA64414.1 MAG: hypothetical protein EOQ27_09725 [Mesorhizobium sp.]
MGSNPIALTNVFNSLANIFGRFHAPLAFTGISPDLRAFPDVRRDSMAHEWRMKGQGTGANMLTGLEVLELNEDGSAKRRGVFDFGYLPRKGDRILMASASGSLETHEVAYIVHSPVEATPSSNAARILKEDRGPLARVYVRFLFEEE